MLLRATPRGQALILVALAASRLFAFAGLASDGSRVRAYARAEYRRRFLFVNIRFPLIASKPSHRLFKNAKKMKHNPFPSTFGQ